MTGGGRRDGGPPERSLSADDILEVLSNYQRRAIIQHLRNSPGQVHSIDEVIDHLKDLERQEHNQSPGEDHLLSVLVHIHGPKLDEAGLIDYDVPTREIRYYPDGKLTGCWSSLKQSLRRSKNRFYISSAVISI